MTDRASDVLRISREALEYDGSPRAAFLDAACGEDGDLRREVEALLANPSVGLGGLLDTPPWVPPALARGQRLGPYEVVGLLGAGGMGTVYQARDTRLKRTVALKVLAGHTALDSASRARFTREARAVAALDHPHICALYDIGRDAPAGAGGTAAGADAGAPIDYLVMEYLEGQTLAARLSPTGGAPHGKPFSVQDALAIGVQIADALAAAHRKGIVHRDLKPGNVMLTPTGAARAGGPQVKLLDFGLAKLPRPPAVPGLQDTSSSPAPSVSSPGAVMGTLPYMAPEQLEGKTVDARADLFSFGCLLYEMLTGRRAFEGDSGARVISSVMTSEPPPLGVAQPAAPPALGRIVMRCLAKDPDARWQSADDLAAELLWLLEPQDHEPAAPRRSRASRTGWALTKAAAGLLAGAGIASAWWLLRGAGADRPVPIHASIPMPAGANLFVQSWRGPIAISPDGTQVAYSARTAGVLQIHVRAVGSTEDRIVEGSAGGESPFFSPDGRWVGFFVLSERRLKRAALSGGAPEVICAASDARGASWGSDNRIVYAPISRGGLKRVAAFGSATQVPEPLTELAPGSREKTHRFPHLLPNGKGVIFTVGSQDIESFADGRIAVFDLRPGRPQT